MRVVARSIKITGLSLLLCAFLLTAGCQRTASPGPSNQPAATPSSSNTAPPANNSGPATPDPTPRPSPRTPLESTLNDMAVFDFVQVLVFTRLDGKALDTTDYQFLKANAPKETNQWAKSTDNLHAVAGTNFVFSPAQLDAQRTHFRVEDVTADYGRKK